MPCGELPEIGAVLQALVDLARLGFNFGNGLGTGPLADGQEDMRQLPVRIDHDIGFQIDDALCDFTIRYTNPAENFDAF